MNNFGSNNYPINLLELATCIDGESYEKVVKYALGPVLNVRHIYKYVDDLYNMIPKFKEREILTGYATASIDVFSDLLNFLLEMIYYVTNSEFVEILDVKHSKRMLEILKVYVSIYLEEVEKLSLDDDTKEEANCFTWQFLQYIYINADIFCKYYSILSGYKHEVLNKVKGNQEQVDMINAYCEIQEVGRK